MTYEFKFPDVGEGIHEGKILELKLKPGDFIKEGDILGVIETDKVVADIPSPVEGKLERFGFMVGDVIKVGEILAYIITEEESINEGAVVGELEKPSGKVLPLSTEGREAQQDEQDISHQTKEKVLASPATRKFARENNIDIFKIKGSGPGGQITRQDILNKIIDKPVLDKKQVTDEIIELSTIRKTIAKNMEKSHRIPSCAIHDFCSIYDLKKLRDNINKDRDEHLSYQAIFIKVLSQVLNKFPIFNSSYNEEKMEIITHKEINIGFAANSDDGLRVPVIKNANAKSILEIDKEMKSLSQAVKNKSITLNDIKDGTFSITNYGSFGGIYGTPLILAPQVAILGIGRIHQALIPKNDVAEVSTILPLSLVFDHRVMDGVPATNFLNFFMEFLQNPYHLMMYLK